MDEDPPSESLSEYCLKLGLQLRGNNDSTKMAASDEKNAGETHQSELHSGQKANYDCKICSKRFTNTRQFTKHKCSMKVPEENPTNVKRKRGQKTKGGKSKKVSSTMSTSEIELTRLEPLKETAQESTNQAEEDEDSSSAGHLADHTYIRDETDGEVQKDGSSSQVVQETDEIIKCESCSALATTEPLLGSKGPTKKMPCEKCKELAVGLKEVPSSEESSDGKTDSKPAKKRHSTGKKRHSTVKKPEELCPHCLKVFSYVKCLANHLKVCKKNKDRTMENECELCGTVLKDNPDDPTQKLPCRKCKKSASSKDPIRWRTESPSHGEVISPDKQQDGTKRKYIFKNPEEFCPHCKKGFHSQKRLEKHMKVCGKDLVCEFCGEDFNNGGHSAYSKYEDHYYTHVEEKPFQCPVCPKGFVRKQELNKHQVIHTTEYSPQECPQCGAAFASIELLRKHARKHDRPTWSCPKCSRQFVRRALFNQHVIVCQKEVSCEICGKVFHCLTKNIKYRYQEHMFIHTGEKPYKCQFCERAFRDRSTRKKHERTHTGEKPYQCTLCDKAFSQLKLLRNHVFTHTGQKPFGCELCNFRFAKQCNLKYHMRVHTKEKPYTCQLCNKSFTQSGTYYKHMRRHENKKAAPEPSATPSSNEVESDATVTITQEGETVDANSVDTVLIQEIPIASDEITIIVSEGNNGTTSIETINVEQISSILASCQDHCNQLEPQTV